MTGSEEAVGMPCFPNLREQSSTGRTGHLAPNGLVRHAGRLLRSDQHATSRRGRDPESDFVSSRVRHADAPGSATWQHEEDSRDPRRAGLLLRQGIHGKKTASGIRFDIDAMVAVHPSYPFGTRLRVTNLANGRSTSVQVVDRGPAPQLRADGIIIDLPRKAAEVLGFIQLGRARVRLEVLAWNGR